MRLRKIKHLPLIIVAVLWILLLAGFLGYKGYTARTGTEILLKVLPVDPRDMFRGDYVALRFEPNVMPQSKLIGSFNTITSGTTMYVSLKIDNGIAAPTTMQIRKPGEGLFLRGTVQGVDVQTIKLEYGIESFFVPEDKGRPIERSRDVYAKVAVDGSGRAVIKSLLVDGVEIK